mgnify:CR=1 FL=1
MTMEISKTYIVLFLCTFMTISCGSSSRQLSQDEHLNSVTDIYSIGLKSLNNTSNIDLGEFKGRYILFVNVASKCGYTPQYEGLEALYKANIDKLVVIGMPCNQFGFQEPGDSNEIASFCKANYGVTFPLSEKLDVKGDNQHPIYEWLTSKKFNKVGDYKVSWNFNKFLLSPEGELLGYFESNVKPQSSEIVGLLK